MSHIAVSTGELAERLPALMLRDAARIGRRLDGLRSVRDPQRRRRDLQALTRQVEQAEARVARRAGAVPRLTYPPQLPVSQRRDDIAATIRDHQVVVVAGETGSGKTTQLPKILLGLGHGVRGQIGHTQPRRLAARAVADRVAEETGTELGAAIGWKVRFSDRVGEDTLVKLMTDGILLAELPHDRDLLGYDAIVVDEAHERSLNIDFLLGYLKSLLSRRPDLKVVITSATIDTERFSRHFDDAPVVEVSGRTYPVEVRYRPYGTPNGDERDQEQAIVDAVRELSAEGPGDVLVFLSGEREIRDTADALRGAAVDAEVLPLFARLSAAEQHRIFAAHPGRRVVLATNVAETSLTVPGIRYVVDTGLARVSRYSTRLKVQRLPIEAVSQASANQRAGRCGRTSDGICIRLYTEEDYDGRPEFTDPEILRTNLASVILQMSAIGLGDVASFPFVDPPDRRNVRDGVQLLEELGALDPAEKDPAKRLTPLGRRLAALPVDPRLGRMVLEAERNGCLRELLVITAALSIQDPRERPAEHRPAADEKHRRFVDPTSDFLAYLNLWAYLRTQQKSLSSSAFRRLCRAEYLHHLRVREWQDLEAQLRQAVKGLGIDVGPVRDEAAAPDLVHRSLLAGLLSHVGMWEAEKREYLGARGARFTAWPGSALFKKPPRWVMAGELVETSRLWGRDLARIDPDWVEPLAGHLVKRVWSEPHWSRKSGAVMAYEKVLLYGLPVVARRRVSYASMDPELCRDLFIRNALVEGDWETRHRFFHDNRALVEDVEELEHRARRRDILVSDDDLFDFYDARIPADVVSARHFDAWWKTERHRRPDLLTFDLDLLVSEDASAVSERDYPDEWVQDGVRLPLSYQFEPGTDADGVTVHVPVGVLNRLSGNGFDWQVPGLRADLVTALIRSLPKALRVAFVPAPDRAREVLARLPDRPPAELPLRLAVGRELAGATGVEVPADAWDLEKVPDHLRMTFRVEDDSGRTLGEGKDLPALAQRLAPRVREQLAGAVDDVEVPVLTGWSIGALPRTVERRAGGHTVVAHPSLVEEGEHVAVRVLASAAAQRRAAPAAIRRLLLQEVASPERWVAGRLSAAERLALATAPHPSVAAVIADATAAAVDDLVGEWVTQALGADADASWVRDRATYEALRDRVRAELPEATLRTVRGTAEVLRLAQRVRAAAGQASSLAVLPALTDVRGQVDRLLPAGFVTASGASRLPDLVRYLRAALRRLEVLPSAPQRDLARMEVVQRVAAEVDAVVAGLPPGRGLDPDVARLPWLVEELRVSQFAQELGTAYPVSEKRVYRALDEVSAR